MVEMSANQHFVYKFGEFVLDPREKSLFAGGRAVHLSAKEFETLLLLVEHNGSALAKDEMIANLWHDAIVEENNLAKQISRLRKALGDNKRKLISTLPKFGYRFSANVTRTQKGGAGDDDLAGRKTSGLPNELASSPEFGSELFADDLNGGYSILTKWLILGGLLSLVFGSVWYLSRQYSEKAGEAAPELPGDLRPVRLTDDQFENVGPSWSDTGKIRFLRIDEKRRTSTWIMNDDGTRQDEVHGPGGAYLASRSPDGSKVIYASVDAENNFVVSGPSGENAIPIPYDGKNLSWAFDSRRFVYQKNVDASNSEIFLFDLTTNENRRLTVSPFFESDPALSPSGTHVAFISDRDGNYEIYEMELATGAVRRLTNNKSIECHPAYSPDGTQILFTSDRDRENSDLFVMNVNVEGEPTNLTHSENIEEIAGPGCWSPDGTSIVFSSNASGRDEIYKMSAESFRAELFYSDPERNLGSPSFAPDGGSVVFEREGANLTSEVAIITIESRQIFVVARTGGTKSLPVWSPNGDSIAYQDRIDGNTEVCRIGTDGRGFQNLSNNPARDGEPSWSSDGRKIAFASNRGKNSADVGLYVMNADGSDQLPLYSRNNYSGGPAWSPDGSTIAFANDSEDFRTGNFEIFSIRAGQGEDPKRLTTRRRSDMQPSFSPDGSRIVFTSTSDGNAEIYVMNSDGTGLLRITRNQTDDSGARWTPDGRGLIFESMRGGVKSALFTVRIS